MSTIASKVRNANKQLMEDGAVEEIGEFFHTKYVVRFGDTQQRGHAAVRGFAQKLHGAFSQLSVDVEILMESDDRIAWQRTIRGTQTGKFHGFPASNRDVIWHDMVVSRMENGKIREEWVVSDLAEALLRSRKG